MTHSTQSGSDIDVTRKHSPTEVEAIDKRLLEEKYKPSKEVEDMLNESWD